MSNLSQIIKENRIKHKLSRAGLARKIGVSRENVSAWELGKYSPSGKALIALMKIFNLKSEDLMKEEQGVLFVPHGVKTEDRDDPGGEVQEIK